MPVAEILCRLFVGCRFVGTPTRSQNENSGAARCLESKVTSVAMVHFFFRCLSGFSPLRRLKLETMSSLPNAGAFLSSSRLDLLKSVFAHP